MDMREIQRLHAQFAPDSMVIDLPRQIAALPAPGNFSADTAPTARARWAKAGPLARGAMISVAVAAVLGMTGMGAALVYTSWRAGHPAASHAAPAQKPLKQSTPTVVENPTPAAREIDAAPAQPVGGAPALSASDFLTGDQFRNALKTQPRPGAPVASPALNSEAERASLTTPGGFPCCVRFPCVHAVATTPAQRLGVLPAHSPSRISLPRNGSRVGLRIDLFEACSAFTRVTACTLALSPYFVTRFTEGFNRFVTSTIAPN